MYAQKLNLSCDYKSWIKRALFLIASFLIASFISLTPNLSAMSNMGSDILRTCINRRIHTILESIFGLGKRNPLYVMENKSHDFAYKNRLLHIFRPKIVHDSFGALWSLQHEAIDASQWVIDWGTESIQFNRISKNFPSKFQQNSSRNSTDNVETSKIA